jgi:hypothetical protein
MRNLNFHQQPRTPPWRGVLKSASSSKSARFLYDTVGVYQIACDCEEVYQGTESEEEQNELFSWYKRQIKRAVPQWFAVKTTEIFVVDWVLFGGYAFYIMPAVLLWVIFILKGK